MSVFSIKVCLLCALVSNTYGLSRSIQIFTGTFLSSNLFSLFNVQDGVKNKIMGVLQRFLLETFKQVYISYWTVSSTKNLDLRDNDNENTTFSVKTNDSKQ